jgi:FimV-like protein
MPLEILGRIAGLDAPFSPADGFDTCGRALLAARVAALGIACFWAGRTTSSARARVEALLIVAAFAASLAVRVAFLPFLVVAVVGSARTAWTWGAWAGVIACTVAGALVSAPTAQPDAMLSPPDHNPALELLRWAEADNAFRARFWATQWAARERTPGPGSLALARAYRALGHAEEARRVAERVAAEGDAPAREDAAALLRSWVVEGKPGGP